MEQFIHIENLQTDHYEETGGSLLARVRFPIALGDIWYDLESIPFVNELANAPNGTIDESELVQVHESTLVVVEGSRYEPTSGALARTIPAALYSTIGSDGPYAPVLKAGTKSIPYNTAVWILDSTLGVVEFPNGLPDYAKKKEPCAAVVHLRRRS